MSIRILCLAGLALSLATGPAAADVGLTGNCQDDIRALQDEMKSNQDAYTVESRTRANAEIASAKTNLVNPVKCRKNLHDANAELRKGKKAKKEKSND